MSFALGLKIVIPLSGKGWDDQVKKIMNVPTKISNGISFFLIGLSFLQIFFNPAPFLALPEFFIEKNSVLPKKYE